MIVCNREKKVSDRDREFREIVIECVLEIES